VQQQFDMVGLLDGSIDAAEAMTYNEYAQVLEAPNERTPEEGDLYTAADFNVISYEDVGVGMLQDAIWADESRLAEDPAYVDIATRFLAASIEGWVHCRDNPEECRDLVVAAGSQLGNSHQLWQMNEINKLIWPSPEGIGITNADAWNRTVEIALNTPNLEDATVLTEEPSEGAYTNDIVTAAHALLPADLDITGESFAPIPVEDIELQEGGA
jgi:NitT/TauT family transport system substrate-binding protein